MLIFTKDQLAGSKVFLPIRGDNPDHPYPVTLQVNGALGSDVITVELWDEDDNTPTDDYDDDGVVLVISATIPRLTFYGPVNIRVSKPVTTNNISLTKVSV